MEEKTNQNLLDLQQLKSNQILSFWVTLIPQYMRMREMKKAIKEGILDYTQKRLKEQEKQHSDKQIRSDEIRNSENSSKIELLTPIS